MTLSTKLTLASLKMSSVHIGIIVDQLLFDQKFLINKEFDSDLCFIFLTGITYYNLWKYFCANGLKNSYHLGTFLSKFVKSIVSFHSKWLKLKYKMMYKILRRVIIMKIWICSFYCFCCYNLLKESNPKRIKWFLNNFFIFKDSIGALSHYGSKLKNCIKHSNIVYWDW